MRTPVARFQAVFRRWLFAGARLAPLDETRLFTDEQVRFLAERGVIYLTERPDGRYSTIIAHDVGSAARIAGRRTRGAERVLGVIGVGFLRHLRDPDAEAQTDGTGSALPAQDVYA